MFKHSIRILSSMGLVAALCGYASSSAAANLPAVQHAEAGTFMTGGIGLDESTAMKGEMKHWPLAMQFAEREGKRAEYVSDVRVAVTDPKGHTTMKAVSQGPFLFADVRPGTYKVAATLDNKTMRQTVEVKKGVPVKLSFVWPAGTGTVH